MATIGIISGNPSTQQLNLSDHGHTHENKGKSIKWKIEKNSNVASIENIDLKPGSPNIFSERPKNDGKKWKAKIDKNASNYAESEYFIKWMDFNGHLYTHDPKISVKPSFMALKWLIVCIVGLSVAELLRRQISKR
ncbi:hypothetical protein [Daejeonella oryzae]|uniref:hypothetical protein n=1 Tax=Daejeonella oryzae TaxID=1122943 RepID=UPI0003F9B9BF|nr:hypothetical protein [Daejeonella oryzae]